MVERVIRTIKNKIYTYFTATGSWNWYNFLHKIIQNYNNTIHRSIKCTPLNARTKINKLLYINNIQLKHKKQKTKFKINDKVRISKYKHNFSKGYTPNWTTEVFTVTKILNTNPITYQITDNKNNIILGCFYDQELAKTDFPNTYLIERVVKRKKNKLFVKWLGFDSSHNSWITSNDILK